MFRKKTNQPIKQTSEEASIHGASDKVNLKDMLSKGIACIPTKKTASVDKKDYSIDDFIVKNQPQKTTSSQIAEPKIDNNIHSISSRMKISGSAGGIIIEKFEDEGSDFLVNEIVESTQTDIIMQRPQDVLHEWSNFSELQIGAISLVNKELQKILKFIEQSKNGELTAVQASEVTPEHIKNAINILKTITEETNNYKDNAVMSLGLQISARDMNKAVINRILSGFILKKTRNEFIEYLVKEGYIKNAASVGNKELDVD